MKNATQAAPASDSAPSRRGAVAWTLAFLVSNLVLFAWLFRNVAPWDFAAQIYFSKEEQTPFVYGIPALLLTVSGLFAWLKLRGEKIALRIIKIITNPVVIVASFFALFALYLAFAEGKLDCIKNVSKAIVGIIFVVIADYTGEKTLESWPFKLNRARFDSQVEWHVLSSALGLGLMSLIVFMMGAFHVFHVIPKVVLLPAAIAISRSASKRNSVARLRADLRQSRISISNKSPLIFALLAFLALFLLLHTPLIWSAPLDYDVLEYHLAAPAQYVAQGQITFLYENIYSNFPENGEMLYLLAMQFAGNRFAALPCAHIFLLASWVLTIAGVYVLGRRLAKSIPIWGEEAAETAPAIAALLYALIPLGSQLAADFFVEHFQALFHLCAVLCAVAYLSESRLKAFFNSSEQTSKSSPSDWLYAAGMFAGLGCGTKYTALLFTLAPLLVLLPLFSANLKEAFGCIWRVALPACVMFAPWTIRNLWVTGDPLYPLGVVLKRRIVGASGLPDRLDHFEAAHRSGEISVSAFFAALKQIMPGMSKSVSLVDVECGPQLLGFTIPALGCLKSPETIFAALVLALDFALWFFASHRLNRFLYPQLSILAALGGVGAAGVWRVTQLRKVCIAILAAFILFFAPVQLLWPWLYSSREAPGRTQLEEARAQFESQRLLQRFEGFRAAAAIKPAESVLFLGEAQTFYSDNAPKYSVVFNRSVLEEILLSAKTREEIRAQFKQRGITHLYLNYSEWMRLDTTYALVGVEGRTQWNRASWPEETSHLMAGLLRAGRFKAYAEAWPENTFPAYLKLNDAQYTLFEEFFSKHTRRVWPKAEEQFGVSELRVIE